MVCTGGLTTAMAMSPLDVGQYLDDVCLQEPWVGPHSSQGWT